MNKIYQKAWNPYDIPTISSQITQPTRLLTRAIDLFFSLLRPSPPPKRGITLICISDTHNLIPISLPPGDILIHAGDLTNNGTPEEIQTQYDWLLSQPHKHKIVIAGNHDPYFKNTRSSLETTFGPSGKGKHDSGVIYLQDSSVTLDFPSGPLKIYGDPHTPDILGPDHAFQYNRSEDFWMNRIPSDADVVVTHGPPACHLDLPAVFPMGCVSLLREVRRVKPLVHVFGHIHAGKSDWVGVVRGGQESVFWDEGERLFAELMKRGSPAGFLMPMRFVVACSWGAFYGVVLRRRTPYTTMVNSSMMFRNTGRLGNEAQVVHI